MTRSAIPGLLRRRRRGRAVLLLCAVAWAANSGAGGAEPAERAEPDGLEEPFRGITANGQPVFGLFPVESTGVSTAPVIAAADAFLEALSQEQRQRVRFPVDGPEWRRWNPHRRDAPRSGLSLAEMSAAARGAALELLEACLSAGGFELARNIMSGEPGGEGSAKSREWRYRIAVLGEPSASEPWGWQLEGDHLVINYFVLGDQVVMSPLFLGAETATAGRPAALPDEQDGGAAMLQSLTEPQRRMASIDGSHDGNGIVAAAHSDNAILENVGIPASLMDREQRSRLLDLIELYVGNLRERHAAVKMAEVEAHLDDTYFGWIGGGEDNAVSYYRIFSPVILIEFEHQAAAADQPAHLHALVRTPNGNDYGKALLAQHLVEHPHE